MSERTYRHPRTLADVPGQPPAVVDLQGESVPVNREGDTATFTTSDGSAVEAFARAYGLTADDLVFDGTDAGGIEADIEAGICPWCDDYEGDAVAQHASGAHPDEWTAYKEASD